MQKSLSFPPLPASANDEKPCFNVVIAYEDFEMGKQAKETYDLLTQHLADDFVFNNQMWKFDVLAVSKLREMAAKDAASADIIIISAHGRHDLPAEVKSWLEMAFEEGIHAIGMVALFDASEPENRARNYLQSLAQSANLEFFAQPSAEPESAQSQPADSSSKTLSILADITHRNRNISHWGINE